MGISYELFWTLNPKKMKPFIEAQKIKAEQWAKEKDMEAWLNGQYIAQAIASCFSKKRYPKKPNGIKQNQASEEENLCELPLEEREKKEAEMWLKAIMN